MQYVLAFVAGFLSTLVFHQGLLAIFRAAGATDETPYSLKPTAPLGVPAVLSFAAWGGAWGVLLWLGLRAVGPGSDQSPHPMPDLQEMLHGIGADPARRSGHQHIHRSASSPPSISKTQD